MNSKLKNTLILIRQRRNENSGDMAERIRMRASDLREIENGYMEVPPTFIDRLCNAGYGLSYEEMMNLRHAVKVNRMIMVNPEFDELGGEDATDQ